MNLSDTLYGKEILESMRKSKKRYIKLLLGLCLMFFSIFSVFAYLIYKESGLGKLETVGPIALGGISIYFIVLFGLACWRTPEKILDKSIDKKLKTAELKRLFVEELNQKPSCILKLEKRSGKVLFTKHFIIHYNEKKATFLNVTIMRLDDMDDLSVIVTQSNGIITSYVHRYEKRNQPKCVQKITFLRKSDSDAFLERVFMLRPQLEIKN